MEINFNNIDCIEFMKTKPNNYYDLAIVDPPYGIQYHKEQKKGGKGRSKLFKIIEWDNAIPTDEYFNELKRVSKNQIIWGGNYYANLLKPSRCWISWYKMQKFNGHDFELAWTSLNKLSKQFNMSRVEAYSKGKIHPTQKPIALYEFILDTYADKGMKILDTHGGSMTIAIACDKKGFDLDICEIDIDYFNNGVKKYNEYKQQTTLF